MTGAPACQRFPGRELPSPMLTARQPDELSVSSNSPHSSHSTPPPGRSHCFTFHWALLLYSALDAYLCSFSFGTWQPCYLADPLTKTISTEHCGASGRLHNTGWQGRTMASLRLGSWILHLCVVAQREHCCFTARQARFKSWLWSLFCLRSLHIFLLCTTFGDSGCAPS